MPAREINPCTALTRDPSFSGHNDRRAITASGHDYALDRSAIGAGTCRIRRAYLCNAISRHLGS